jgi:molecular chaperone DnaJ
MNQPREKECNVCNKTGRLKGNTTLSVSIPAGIKDGNILRLQSMGNYYLVNAFGGIFGMEQYQRHFTDAYLQVFVSKQGNLSIDNTDVISNLILPLSEAVRGTTKKIETIYGEHEITISKLSKNKDEVVIPKYGVGGSGNQRVILNVEYPENILEII